MSPIAHGGRLDEAIAAHGGLRKQWLDLSTGINPTSWPVPNLPQALWHRLPEESDVALARDAARAAYGVPADAGIVVAPGTQALIQHLPGLVAPQPVAIIGPTYEEHRLSWARHGHEALVVDGIASAEASARIVVVVNPDNPTGRLHDPARLAALAKRLAARGGWLVVDEAFADVAPEASVAEAAGRDGLVVLRSLGKFYGLAGARIGFALTTKQHGPAGWRRRSAPGASARRRSTSRPARSATASGASGCSASSACDGWSWTRCWSKPASPSSAAPISSFPRGTHRRRPSTEGCATRRSWFADSRPRPIACASAFPAASAPSHD